MAIANLEIINLIAQTIYDKKGSNIYAVDVRGVSTLTDTFIIAEGSVGRQTRAIAEALEELMGKRGITPLHVEGKGEGEWIVIDFDEVVVHLMVPDFRERYALEELWPEGKIIELSLNVG